jgi:hypothetical protein
MNAQQIAGDIVEQVLTARLVKAYTIFSPETIVRELPKKLFVALKGNRFDPFTDKTVKIDYGFAGGYSPATRDEPASEPYLDYAEVKDTYLDLKFTIADLEEFGLKTSYEVLSKGILQLAKALTGKTLWFWAETDTKKTLLLAGNVSRVMLSKDGFWLVMKKLTVAAESINEERLMEALGDSTPDWEPDEPDHDYFRD